jgi:tRNA(Ile)-lysidine synthase
MTISESFRQILESLGAEHAITRYVVAYSGGVDSHTLLHLCAQLRLPLRAVHIHHGLQTVADAWDVHCERVCRQLGIDYVCIEVDAGAVPGESPEDAARNARYDALLENIQPDECVLSAHHRGDQAETLLLQLLRGAGPAGLASMPRLRVFGSGYHARPLLGFDRAQLLEYAHRHKLRWIEDPSNIELRYDRNYLRAEILPRLQQRWPGLEHSLAQVADLQQQSLQLCNDLAAIDLAAISLQQPNAVSVNGLRRLASVRQYNLLRYWINRSGFARPRRSILREVIDNVLPASVDATPVVLWGGAEVRRYRDGLYLLRTIDDQHYTQIYAWDGAQPLLLDKIGIKVQLQQQQGAGLSPDAVRCGLSVRFRQGGENIRPYGRYHTHSLKKLMQEAAIPPWQRNRIPLVYIDNELACVCGYWIAASFSISGEQQGWVPVCLDTT